MDEITVEFDDSVDRDVQEYIVENVECSCYVRRGPDAEYIAQIGGSQLVSALDVPSLIKEINEIGAPDEITVGTLIEDKDLHILGRVTSIGNIKFGRKQLAGYRITILTGHERGRNSIIMQDDAVFVAPPNPEA